MRWTLDNKVAQVTKGNRYIRYWYDASGNRVMKRLHGDTVDYILRDASGNELQRLVRRQNSGASPILMSREASLYGSSRLGTYQFSPNPGNDSTERRSNGKTTYELTDHLGNVRATVSDQKTYTAITGGYTLAANVLSANDYFPFGMPSRTFQPGYKWGFNGKENDSELLAGGRIQDYGFRGYRPDLGRFFAVDPLTKDYPELTTYQFASNTPIQAIDLDGLEMYVVTYFYHNGLPGRVTIDAIRDDKTGELVQDLRYTINGRKVTDSKIYVVHLNEDGTQFAEPEQRNVLNTVESLLVARLKDDKNKIQDDIWYELKVKKNGRSEKFTSRKFEDETFSFSNAEGKLKLVDSWQGDENGTSAQWLSNGTQKYRNDKKQLLYVSNTTSKMKNFIRESLQKLGAKIRDIIFGKRDSKNWTRKDTPAINTYELEKK